MKSKSISAHGRKTNSFGSSAVRPPSPKIDLASKKLQEYRNTVSPKVPRSSSRRSPSNFDPTNSSFHHERGGNASGHSRLKMGGSSKKDYEDRDLLDDFDLDQEVQSINQSINQSISQSISERLSVATGHNELKEMIYLQQLREKEKQDRIHGGRNSRDLSSREGSALDYHLKTSPVLSHTPEHHLTNGEYHKYTLRSAAAAENTHNDSDVNSDKTSEAGYMLINPHAHKNGVTATLSSTSASTNSVGLNLSLENLPDEELQKLCASAYKELENRKIRQQQLLQQGTALAPGAPKLTSATPHSPSHQSSSVQSRSNTAEARKHIRRSRSGGSESAFLSTSTQGKKTVHQKTGVLVPLSGSPSMDVEDPEILNIVQSLARGLSPSGALTHTQGNGSGSGVTSTAGSSRAGSAVRGSGAVHPNDKMFDCRNDCIPCLTPIGVPTSDSGAGSKSTSRSSTPGLSLLHRQSPGAGTTLGPSVRVVPADRRRQEAGVGSGTSVASAGGSVSGGDEASLEGVDFFKHGGAGSNVFDEIINRNRLPSRELVLSPFSAFESVDEVSVGSQSIGYSVGSLPSAKKTQRKKQTKHRKE